MYHENPFAVGAKLLERPGKEADHEKGDFMPRRYDMIVAPLTETHVTLVRVLHEVSSVSAGAAIPIVKCELTSSFQIKTSMRIPFPQSYSDRRLYLPLLIAASRVEFQLH